jgi:hypothetical protein
MALNNGKHILHSPIIALMCVQPKTFNHGLIGLVDYGLIGLVDYGWLTTASWHIMSKCSGLHSWRKWIILKTLCSVT